MRTLPLIGRAFLLGLGIILLWNAYDMLAEVALEGFRRRVLLRGHLAAAAGLVAGALAVMYVAIRGRAPRRPRGGLRDVDDPVLRTRMPRPDAAGASHPTDRRIADDS